MSMSKYCRAALFLLLALFLPVSMSCSDAVLPTVPLVRLRLNGLPEGTNKVTVTITIGDTTRTVDFVRNGTDPLDTVTVSFPEGTTGEVTISISARDEMDCLIGSGSGNIVLTNNDVRELPIGMTRPTLACGTPAAKIIVQITNTGTAMGRVTSQPAGIDCGNACDAVFKAGDGNPGTGTTVTLQAQAGAGLFLGWSGACSGTDACVLPLDAVGEYIVRAAFGTPQPCATGWCEEMSGTTSDLYGIYGIGPLNIVAVGAGGTIVRWDGQKWGPQTSGVSATLRAVSTPRTTRFIAVGDGGTIVTEDMGTWTPRTDPTGGKALYGVAGVANAETFIVGEAGTLLKGNLATGAFTVRPPNGGVNNPPSALAGKVVRAISAAPSGDQLTFVGDTGVNYKRRTFGSFDIYDAPASGVTRNLNGIWFLADGMFAVGAMGTLARRGGPDVFGNWPTSWNVEAAPPVTTDLWAVFAVTSTQAFAVGQGGVILQFDGTTWTRRTSNTTKNLYAIWGAGASNIYAVGEGGTIMHFLP